MGANITWPKGKPIEVCWNIESSQTDAAKRGPVKTAIEQGWSRVSGVQFVGWDFTGDGKADGIAVGNSTLWGPGLERMELRVRPPLDERPVLPADLSCGGGDARAAELTNPRLDHLDRIRRGP